MQVTYTDAQGSSVKIVCQFEPEEVQVHLEDGDWASGTETISLALFQHCMKSGGRVFGKEMGDDPPEYNEIYVAISESEVRFSAEGRVAVMAQDDLADLQVRMGQPGPVVKSISPTVSE